MLSPLEFERIALENSELKRDLSCAQEHARALTQQNEKQCCQFDKVRCEWLETYAQKELEYKKTILSLQQKLANADVYRMAAEDRISALEGQITVLKEQVQ